MPASRQVREQLAAQIAELERRQPGADAAPGPDQTPTTAAPANREDGRRRRALTAAGGQDAHDEALGVGEFAPLPAKRPKQQKPAQLAFSEAPPHQQALDLAYKLVAQRERTAKQLREKLVAKDQAPEAIDAALDELQRLGFQSDARYAKAYAEDKRRLQGWGDRRIRQELGRAGVAREVIDATLAGEEALDAPTELEAALELLRRKRPDLSDPKVKQRMAAMLARRGIASSTVFAALREHERRLQNETAELALCKQCVPCT